MSKRLLTEEVARKLCECNAKEWEDLDDLGQEGYLRAANEVLPITLKAVGKRLTFILDNYLKNNDFWHKVEQDTQIYLRGEMPEEGK